jgi:serine/threonine protein kinase
MITSFGRYNLLLKLGEGGMGTVYLGCQKTLRRYCAIKVISSNYSRDRESANRFLREARATAALSHPNLVGVYDCDQFDGQYFIAMEYVEGMTLGQILRERGALPLSLALYWFNQAVAGLEYIHGKGIIHRDIKPDNMIVDRNGVLKIMDLGLAKAHLESDPSTTATGTVMGSPHYMSPEQIEDSKTADHRSDLYSLGITFYQMVVGKVPFERSSTTAICIAHLQELVPSVSFPDVELTRSLDDMILRLTAKNKEERFQTASELMAILAPWLANYPMDEAAQSFYGQLGFQYHKVDYLLQREGLDAAQVAADVVTADQGFRTGAPQAPPVLPKRSWHHYVAWAAVVLVILMVTGGILRGIGKKKKQDAPTPATTVVKPSGAPSEKPQLKKAVVLVKTDPPGAQVWLDGISRGTSPCEIEGTAGESKRGVVRLPGYQSAEVEATFREGTVEEIVVELRPDQQNERFSGMVAQLKKALDQSREASPEKWLDAKADILKSVEDKMATQNPQHAKRVRRAVSELGELLEEARALSADQYNQRKGALVLRAIGICASASVKAGVREGPPPRGGFGRPQ